MAQLKIPKKNLFVLMAFEVPVMGGAALRFAMEATPELTESQKVTWFLATVLSAAMCYAVHLVLLLPHLRNGAEPSPEANQRAIVGGLSVLVLSVGLLILGPTNFARFLPP